MERQLDLLPPTAASEPQQPRRIERPGLRLRLWSGWLTDEMAVMERLLMEVPWRQEQVTLFGRRQPMPRLTCWMAEPGCSYAYSGLRQRIEPWTPTVAALRQRVEEAVGWRFNSLLLNLYRDGHDAMGWHADDEGELAAASPIASLSLGAARTFRLRPRPGHRADAPPHAEDGPFSEPLAFELGHGDLLVMDPPSQRHWQHQVPRRLRLRQPRINLTFRVVRQDR
ncbi:MAG: alpha-ketoglutarate-dependent dioxygenase AlkB [Synechococcaceae cyanobacterium]|nr:alpha-ketoglutarate-dependent dioxygenase AlkB [Synechococcaceae cyanobacterium]